MSPFPPTPPTEPMPGGQPDGPATQAVPAGADQPLSPTPAPRRDRSPWLVVAVIVLAVVLVGGGGYLLVGGGGDDDPQAQPTTTAGDADPITTEGRQAPPSSGADSPEETVDAFIAAAAEGDCDTLVSLIADDLGGGGVGCTDGEPFSQFGEVERIGPATVEGDEARVLAEDAADAYSVFIEFVLVEDDDGWLIDDFTFNATSGDIPDDDDSTDLLVAPEAVVEQFIAAAAEGDCEALVELLSDRFLDAIGMTYEEVVAECEDSDAFDLEVSADMEVVGPAEIVGDAATVHVELQLPDGDRVSNAFTLVVQGDEWRVYDFDRF